MLDYLRLQLIRFQTLLAYKYNDWKKITIKENGQPLVQLPNEICFPFYADVMKLSENKNIYLRQEVLERVLKARSFLKKQGFDLRVYDGWRSVELQENLFWYYMGAFTIKRFRKNRESDNLDSLGSIRAFRAYFETLPPEMQSVLMDANRTYVSWPSKECLCPSPHATGGAVDVWLFRDGEAISLGVPFDWMEENAGAFYHLKFGRKRFSGNDQRICNNRKLLVLSMTKAGFTCYGPEIWHFNYGNQMDALVKGGYACYSYIEP